MQLLDNVTQTLPDQFYHQMKAFALVTIYIGGSTLAVAMLWWTPTRKKTQTQTQRKRYLVGLTGILMPVVCMTFILSQYSLSDTITGIGEMHQPAKSISWISLALSLITPLLSMAFIVRAYKVPTHYARYSWCKRYYLTTTEVRASKSHPHG